MPYSAATTEDDVLYCFRLLLGRHPNREEWRGHTMSIGEPLPGVVASYVNSLEFSRRGLLGQDHTVGIALTELDGFRMYSAEDDAAVGRHVRIDNYERDVTQVFRQVLEPGMGVLDIGANIGYFTMLAASIVGSGGYVLAIEPNPRNAKLLEASRGLNGFGHVSVAQVAAGAEVGLLALHTSHSNGTTSGLPDGLNALMASETVPCVPPDRLVASGPPIHLIKVDVEGAEYNALLGCETIIRTHRPRIISELSPDLMPGISGVEAQTYFDWIVAHGYTVAVIRPDGALHPTGERWESARAEYASRGTDHIDILATPV